MTLATCSQTDVIGAPNARSSSTVWPPGVETKACSPAALIRPAPTVLSRRLHQIPVTISREQLVRDMQEQTSRGLITQQFCRQTLVALHGPYDDLNGRLGQVGFHGLVFGVRHQVA